MWVQKFNGIPPNVALWLKDIRQTVELYDDIKSKIFEKNNVNKEMNSSIDSIYDNVEQQDLRRDVEECLSKAFDTENGKYKIAKSVGNVAFSTWPLRKHPKKFRTRSVKDMLEYRQQEEEGAKTWFCLKDENHQIIRFNWLSSKLTAIKRVLNSSDIIYGRRDLGDSHTQEEGEPNIFASMSNTLASHREKHTQECVWTWLKDSVKEKSFNLSASEEDLFSEILSNIKKDIIDFEKRMTVRNGSSKSVNYGFKSQELFGDFERENSDKYSRSLPVNFALCNSEFRSLFDAELVPKKPPVPPKRRKSTMDQRHRNTAAIAHNRRLWKAQLAKAKAVAIPTVQLRVKNTDSGIAKSIQTKGMDKLENDLSPHNLLEISTDNEDAVADKEARKPLPFPAYNPELEYEINELLMMQRVTESSKERRRISTERKVCPILDERSCDFQGYVKNIPGERMSPFSSCAPDESNKSKMSAANLSEIICGISSKVVDTESQDKVKQFLESKMKKVKHRVEPKIPLKLREDVIIDWENDYENLNEPVVLEGKAIAGKRFPNFSPSTKTDSETDSLDMSTVQECLKESSDDESIAKKMADVSDNDVLSISSANEVSSLVSDTSQPNPLKSVSEVSPKLSKIGPHVRITEIVTRCDEILKESDPKSDTEIFDKVSVSSISDGLNTFSDFESDINETIAVGEIWCNEKSSDENISLMSWEVSEDVSSGQVEEENHCTVYTTILEHRFSPFETTTGLSESRLDTIAEDDEKITDKRISVELTDQSGQKAMVRSKSLNDLDEIRILGMDSILIESPSIGRMRSKSLDFFRDYATDNRIESASNLQKHNSITSDVCEWMARIRGIAFPEDRLFSDDDEWILSFDSEERAYFFEEGSKKSLWALPDYFSEDTKPDFNYPIQRSATESAINNESSAKLRPIKDGSKGGRISGSTRSSKAQSMLIEPKFDISKEGNKSFSIPRDLSKIYGEIIRIGVLNKTKISENGKKLRKNWTPAFVVLTDSYLFFFKDAKSFQNMKNVISSNVNHMCLSLQGAVIEKGDKISSRKNVYKISCSESTDVLIQTDKTSDAEEWFKEINSVIQNLPQDNIATSGSPPLDLNCPSKVGRTKSLKVRNKETGSMEDLSATAEERQNKIRARLKKFFIRRPTVDSLKKKGIWKDEPVFGCSLEQITKNRNPRVPIFVEKCIECIESKEENMKTDGLYRASGNLSQVQKIRLEVDQNNLSIMKDEEDVHVLTGSLKLFFRELKEPLIPSKQLEPALLATDKPLRKERIKDFQKIVKSLPTPNHDTLKFLLQHLLRVKEYHKFNRMNINNLAIVFGPTLMWPEQESANMALELMQQNVVIECLLKEFQEIFT